MAALGFAIYAACVDFMLQAATLFGVSYRDANAFMFFVLWPVVTLLLVIIVLAQAWALRRSPWISEWGPCSDRSRCRRSCADP